MRAAILGRDWRVTLLRAAVWGIFIIVVWEFVLTPIRVSGISMLPTYHDREINVINHLAYLRHEPQRGDVIAIRINPDDTGRHSGLTGDLKKLPHAMLFKRIIGLPGETIAFSAGRVLINGKILDEPYETGDCNWTIAPVSLGADEYYVVGDNRQMPQQDHWKGVCKRDQIVGKALL
jgi:signal peptidase I